MIVNTMLVNLLHEHCTFTGLFLGAVKGEALWDTKLLTKEFEGIPSFGFAIHWIDVREIFLISKHLGKFVAIK